MRGEFCSSIKRQNTLKKIFFVYLAVSVCFIAILLLKDKLNLSIFKTRLLSNEVLTDFTQVLFYSLNGKASYSEPYYNIYFPLVLIIFYPFALICKNDFKGIMEATSPNTTIKGWWATQVNPTLISSPRIWLCYVVFILACLVAIFFLLKKIFKFNYVEAIFAISTFVLSAPFIFTFLRGNVIILTFLLVLCFFCTIDSKNKVFNELGLVCLAFASVFKIYPIVFAGFLVNKKQWLNVIKLILYFVILLLFPCIIYEDSLFLIIDNLTGFSNGVRVFKVSNFSITGWTYKMLDLFLPSKYSKGMHLVGKIISLVFLIFGAVCIITTKSTYNKLVLCGSLILVVPGVSYYYGTIFLFLLLPYVVSFEEENVPIKTIIYTILFTSIFCISLKAVTFLSVIVLSIICIVKIIKDKEIILWFKNIKTHKIED